MTIQQQETAPLSLKQQFHLKLVLQSHDFGENKSIFRIDNYQQEATEFTHHIELLKQI